MRQRKPEFNGLGGTVQNAGVAMPAFIGTADFRDFVFLGRMLKYLERTNVRAGSATNTFGSVDDWGHGRFLLESVFPEAGKESIASRGTFVFYFTKREQTTIADATKHEKVRKLFQLWFVYLK